jgi:hypothetical protein
MGEFPWQGMPSPSLFRSGKRIRIDSTALYDEMLTVAAGREKSPVFLVGNTVRRDDDVQALGHHKRHTARRTRLHIFHGCGTDATSNVLISAPARLEK